MTNNSRNPYTGRNSSGYRFRFQVSSIAHHTLFLPIEMKSLPQIQQLLQGISPRKVFNSYSIDSARQEFRKLRKKYDFDYWAVTEYFIHDLADADSIVPLRLNDAQFVVIDTFRKRYSDRSQSRYIVTKSFRRCGLSTCIQAYILWSQLHRHTHHSITCTDSGDNMNRLKAIVANCAHTPVGHSSAGVKDSALSLFQSTYDPHVLDRCPSSYVHLADMSKWRDPTSELTAYVYSNAYKGWNVGPDSLFVLEGDMPSHPMFRAEDYRNYIIPESFRLMQLSDFCSNPYFANRLITVSDPRVKSEFHYINLDQAP